MYLIDHMKRWLSLRAYGLVTSTIFRATASPQTMRSRFERLNRVRRSTMQRKFSFQIIGWLRNIHFPRLWTMRLPRGVS